jgi:uncharacterized protein YdeI (YjbR/CyaY-like superfamily)
MAATTVDLPTLLFPQRAAWRDWLDAHHQESPGVWLKIAKAASEHQSVSYAEALEVALCYGWIDGQKQRCDESFWLQKCTPRRKKSLWSKVNREKALDLIRSRQMMPAGMAEVERAQQDGRWEAAYASQGRAEAPPDFQAELDKNPEAKAFFATLDSSNRYAFLFRIQTAKKPETRAKRIDEFTRMLERHEKLHP